MSRSAHLLVAVALVAGCSSDTKYLIVTVDARPTVHAASALTVTLANAGTSRTDTLQLGSHAFPVTFSVTTPGRTGDLDIQIDAQDGTGALVGRGEVTTPLTSATAELMLDGADFVVNSDFAGDQFLSDDFEAIGLQLSATSDGTWMAAFRDSCGNGSSCNIFGRRFDPTGEPVSSVVDAGDNAFPVTTTFTEPSATPAIAAAGSETLVFWDYLDVDDNGAGVACRALDGTGNAIPDQVEVANGSDDAASDVVTATPLSNLNFAVTWQTFPVVGNFEVVRSMIVKPDCTAASAPTTISTNLGMGGAGRSHVAANMSNVLYAWVVDGDVHVRPGNNAGAYTAPESTIITHTADLQVNHVRLTALGSGFGVVARWASPAETGPGMMQLYLVSPLGVIMGNPILITDQSESDFVSAESFGVATRSDQAMMIVWHQCPTGAGSCDVYGRIVRPTGLPVGDPFEIPTSTTGDQSNPSVVALPGAFVVAWNDSSGTAPDMSGLAVRARIISPPYDDASAVLGAQCGTGKAACAMGLICAGGTDSTLRCYQPCTTDTPPACPAGGTCDTAAMACTF